MAVLIIVALISPAVGKRTLKVTLLSAPIVAGLAILGTFGRLVEENSVTRLMGGLGVLTGGAQTAPDLAVRYQGWGSATAMASQYALGTLGPPQMKLESSIDSQFISYYLQGGPILVIAYVLALLSPVVLWRRGVPRAWALAAMSGTIAIFSYTGAPLDSSMASSLAWVAAGISLAMVRHPSRIGPPDAMAIRDDMGSRWGRDDAKNSLEGRSKFPADGGRWPR